MPTSIPSFVSRSTNLIAVLSASLLVAGCGSSDNGPATNGAPFVGKPDQAQGSSLTVDEAGLFGQVDSGRIHLTIPVHNGGAFTAKGALSIAIEQVDGKATFDSSSIPYQLASSSFATLETELGVPQGVSAQADWSAFNVLIKGPDGDGLRVTRSLLTVAGSYDVRLEGPATLTRARPVTYRVRAQNPLTHAALVGVPVGLNVRNGAAVVASYKAMTGDKGDAIFDVSVDVEGSFTVEGTGATQGTNTVVSDTAKVQAPGSKVLLTSDKPIYQPGQVIHLRALALDATTQAPVSAQPVVFEIADGKGNKICKRTLQSDKYGLASTDFTLGQVLNMGTFQVDATAGAAKATKTVTVSTYALPKFKVDVTPDKPWYTPGQTVGGTIDALYFFGQPAAGADVVIEASTLDIGATVFARVMGKTDAQGRFAFSIMLPTALVGLPIQQGSGLVNLSAQVTDSAGQVVTQQQPMTVSARALRLALVPESTVLVPGLPNRLDLFVTDPLGNPAAGAAVDVSLDGTVVFTGTTDIYGQATFDSTPLAMGASSMLNVQAMTKDGLSVAEAFSLNVQEGASHVLVRTDQAVYGLGDTVTVDVATSSDSSAVFIDWLNNGQDVDMRTLDVVDGAAHFTKTVDTGLVGSNRIEAYIVGVDGNIVRAGRTVFVRDAGGLSVDLTADQPQYLPGAPATLTLSVKDETGAPAVAALGVQIVDQAVFALVDAQPGLLRTYFQLEDEFSQPSYEIRPPIGDVQKLLFEDTSQPDHAAAAAAQVRASATFAALGEGSVMGIQKSSWQDLAPAVLQKLTPFYQSEKTRLTATITQVTSDALATLKGESCVPSDYFCNGLQTTFFQALQAEVGKRLVNVYDFWGNAYLTSTTGFNEVVSLTTSGPDERAGTADDFKLSFLVGDLNLPADVANTTLTPGGFGRGADGAADGGAPIFNGGGMVAPGATGAAGAGGVATTGAGGGTATDSSPRVRQSFPETLYVNPELITGPDGKATISLDMADSITDWRVSTLAHTLGGKVGGGVGDVRVFQEFFVDVDFPATLTRGDQVEFPIVIYNYLTTPQTVHVSLAPGAWYTPLGTTTSDVQLAAGQVTGIRFPVRVDAVGRQTLTVKAIGSTRSDAVARSVEVLPDGKAFPLAQSGSLAPGSATRTVSFPPATIAGSEQMYVNVFPAYLSQVVQGMDSLLRVPTGCFEQTTSTAWPNVLVTSYLQQTNQLKPDVQLKAESLMSAGNQRLLTFEHKGGGFSWFGEQDPAPFLSVTAFGLMEFSDMAKVQMVDAAMVDRTTRWLVGQQAADGSWAGDRSEFFTFQTSLVRNTAFVVWALASSGYKGPELAKGIAYVEANLGDLHKADAYSLGIVANALLTASPADPFAGQIIAQIASSAVADGEKVSWDTGGTQTNFYGQGADGAVATTGLCTRALLLAGGHADIVGKALAFLTASRDSQGNFGSTQATIWTLRALLLAATTGTEGAVGTLDVAVDGASFGQVVMTKDQADVMTTVDLGSLATIGAHDIGLTFTGTGKVSYNLVSQYNVPWSSVPVPPAPPPIAVTVAYDKTQLLLQDVATATVTIKNNTPSHEDMILVTVGLPPGFQVATEDLDAYKASRVLSSYELTGKQLILYVPALEAHAIQAFVYHLRATMPVKASDGGAVVALYYQPDQKSAAQATTIEVVAGPSP